MLSLESRKKITKETIRRIENVFLSVTDKREYAGLFLVGFHYLIVMFPVAYIFFGTVDIYYYISGIIYLMIVILHYYFNGCILTRTERSLFNSKEWYGPPSFLLYGLDDISKNRSNNMVALLALLVVSQSVLKMFYDINIWYLILITILIFRNY
tara:strand:+ start:61 stop:522 length:462 start_codon:yes stop_codon:yes gene_type:complete